MKTKKTATVKPIKSLLAEMKAAKATLRAAESAVNNVGKEIIEACPKKVGDRVTVNAGWCHLKKEISITRIDFDTCLNEYKFQGLVIKGDGTLGKLRGQATLKAGAK